MKTNKIEIGFSPKQIKLENGLYLCFWYANNAGRGDDNCTIILTDSDERSAKSKDQHNVIAMVRTSSWNGNVNFSKYVQKQLGLIE